MNTYYVKLLLFTFLINVLISPYYENCEISHYNIILITKNTQETIIKSRLLAQTQNHNPHYHNDPELKEMIDKLNEEAIKKYQQTHDPYEQLRELVEKKGTKLTGRYGAEPMSTLEKELLETYEEVFGEENHIMLKSGRYPNDDDESDDSSACECTDINGVKLAKTKGRDKYLKHLKHRCIGGICSCSVGSFLLTVFGWHAAEAAAAYVVLDNCSKATISSSVFTINNILDYSLLKTAITEAVGASLSACAGDAAQTAASAAIAAFPPYGIAALVLLILAVVIIILYIWLYRRRKNSWKHECKKHLCK
ncbi:stevor PIR protein, putative [Plasmodium reichenowi]|uniref:Stevor PIR protein, putative n=1 Tax=Plasmodium reichenowi TaxID=5854 RepID=A0A2P9D4T5_PLARE|nr:stevor PIR protein, putative [Plasmodium reichenowi]